MLKMAIITGFLSKTRDRFHEYNKLLDLEQKFELMSEIEGYDGVEIVYPRMKSATHRKPGNF